VTFNTFRLPKWETYQCCREKCETSQLSDST